MRRALVAALAILVAPHARGQQALVDFGSPAAWIANAADPLLGTTWTDPAFDDSSWNAGSYGIGYETGTGAAALLRTNVPAATLSVYTRARFDVPDPAQVTSMTLGCDYDDGVVAWLNGTEIWRSPEMPAGPPAWDAAASLHESSNAAVPDPRPVHDMTAYIPLLRAGTNVLAVGAWNATLPSSDLVLVPQLLANPPLEITRGPYLQSMTPASVVVRWRTNVPSDSVVRFGSAPGSLASTASDAAMTSDHAVTLAGLSPSASYAYSVGATGRTLAGDDAAHVFTTAPPTGSRGPVHAWVVGDSGTADANARRVRDAWRARDAGRPPDFWLLLGDNAYDTGADDQYQRAVFDMYPDELRRSCAFPTFGNHDALSASSTTQSGVYFDAFTLPASGEAGGVASGTEAYYSFDWANVHFACLDSQESDRSPAGAMAQWLQADLAATAQEWIVAFFHHPPYTKGSHDSDVEIRHVEMRRDILPILEDFGVDLVLSGHSHSYERSFLLDGHYGDSTTLLPASVLDGGDGRVGGSGAYVKPGPGAAPHAGEVCVVAGSSGQTEAGGALDHPAMFVSLLELGSLVLDVRGNRLDATFLDDLGAVRDEFTILKQSVESCANGTDDDLDGLADCADPECSALDADLDAHPDCADCAPSDAGAFAAPPEVPLLFVRDRGALSWTDVSASAGPVLTHDVATGVIGELLADRAFARASCLARDVAALGITDARPAPRSSDGWWYLVRARNACAAGAWGVAVGACP